MQVKIDKTKIVFEDDTEELTINCTEERLKNILNAFSSYISLFENKKDETDLNLERVIELTPKKYLRINLNFQDNMNHIFSMTYYKKTSSESSDEIILSSMVDIYDKITSVKNMMNNFSEALRKYFPKKEKIIIVDDSSSDSDTSAIKGRKINANSSNDSSESRIKIQNMDKKIKNRLKFFIRCLEVLTDEEVLVLKRGIKILYDKDNESYSIEKTKETSKTNWCFPFNVEISERWKCVERLKESLSYLKKVKLPLTHGKLLSANEVMNNISVDMFKFIEANFCIPMKKERTRENFEEFVLSDAWEDLKNESISNIEDIKSQIFDSEFTEETCTFENFYFLIEEIESISESLILSFKTFKKEAQKLKEMEARKIREIKELEEIERVKMFIPEFENPKVSIKKLEPDEILVERDEDLFLPNKRIVVNTNPEDLSRKNVSLEGEIKRIKKYMIRDSEPEIKFQSREKPSSPKSRLFINSLLPSSDDEDDVESKSEEDII